MTTVSLIVPCYNESAALRPFMAELRRLDWRERMRWRSMTDVKAEVIFVNDGSRDDTLSIIRELAAQQEGVRYVSFSRNFGKEAAMLAGFSRASGDYAAVMDADLQDPPALLPELLKAVREEGYDCAGTRRVNRKGEPPIRSFFARMFYRIINRISDADIVDGARDFRLMKREMVDAIVAMCEYNRFSKGIFGWIGFRTKWLPYKNVERVAGETKWSFWGLFKYSIDGIVNFSQAPLSIASLMGLLLTIASFCAIVFIVLRRLIFGDPVAGWASTACIILFMGGLQLLCMGIMGQYLAKTYLEVKRRPHYIIAETNDESAKLVG